jgi:O-antigen/teichoic acid export membrane protein
VTGADPLAVPPPLDPPHPSFAATVGRLTTVNAVALAAAVVAGPITARALGAEGRGELAAIIAVLTIGPVLFDLGLGQWLARERARGGRRSDLLGAALPIALCGSLAGVALAVPVSQLLGAGRPVVTTFLLIGMLLMPVSVLLHVLVGLAIGESRWRLYAATRVVGSVVPVLAIVALALAGWLTVASAAAAYLLGGLLGGLLLLQRVRGIGRLSFHRDRARGAAGFGAKSWLSQVAGTANNRLDQALMAGLVSSRQLGLYAVAVTIASITHGLSLAVSSALFPRIAEGDREIAARSCRMTTCFVLVVGGALAVASPAMIPFVFGGEFDDAVPMVIVLLVASVPLAASVVLAAALVAANEPGAAMRAELVALAVTIPALVLFVPGTGGLGAATISLIAYALRLAVALRSARRAFAAPWWSFVLPTAGDMSWLRGRVRRVRLDSAGTR